MQYGRIEGKGKTTTLVFGGNVEMVSIGDTIEKFKPMLEENEETVIVAAISSKKSDSKYGREGLRWEDEARFQSAVKVIEENNTNNIECYSSGSLCGILALDELISSGSDLVESLVLYDGLLGITEAKEEFQNIIDNRVKVTLYYTDEGIDAYKMTREELEQKYGNYPNVEIIYLENSNHGTVITGAIDYENEKTK